MSLRDRVESAFRQRFGGDAPLLVRAPGRVNLIGEHTDYNGGFVLPIAIDREVWIALAPRGDGHVAVHSLDYGDTTVFELSGLSHTGDGWPEYVKGVAWALQQAGRAPGGWQGVMGGNVPRGAGLSSSAAVELAALRAFAAVTPLPWDAKAMALLGQRVENGWIGVNSGIMDQLVVAAGIRDHALLIDCRSLEIEPAPLPPAAAVIVLDTSTRRGLVDSAYNERRSQCEEAARYFGVPALRDVDSAGFAGMAVGLDPVVRRRARHVVTENERTLEAAHAMRAGDVRRLGELMNASHESLRVDFEVTNAALDAIVGIAQAQPMCLGARMTGAGFGGCAVALVAAEGVEAFIEDVTVRYRDATGLVPRAYACRAADGASLERAVSAERAAD
jgi:galactokinase